MIVFFRYDNSHRNYNYNCAECREDILDQTIFQEDMDNACVYPLHQDCAKATADRLESIGQKVGWK